VRPLRADEVDSLTAALGDAVSAGQIANRWREMEMGLRELLGVELDGELVGTVSIGETTSPAGLHLFALEIGAPWRSRGVGTRVVEQVVREAARRGLGRVYLEVRVDNPARRLYHRLGFRRTGAAFSNFWWRFEADGSRERVEEPTYRMVKRVVPAPGPGAAAR
jgi:ribosomal protein S18 acetylase RimI-like enzyme